MNEILKYLKTTNGIYIKNVDKFFANHNIITKLTGFTGSEAKLFIHKLSETKNKFYLLVDGRYPIQAQNECKRFFANTNNCYEIVNLGQKNNAFDWVKNKTSESKNKKILCPYETCTFEEINNLNNIIKTENINLPIKQTSSKNLIIRLNKNKIKIFCNKITNTNDYMLIANPAIVCWLLGIIGQDQPYSNIKNCYCIINDNNIDLFIDELTKTDAAQLSNNKINIYSTKEIEKFITQIPKSAKILLDPKNTSGIFFSWIKNYTCYNIKNFYKGQYTDEEITSTKLAHIYDAKIINSFLEKIQQIIDDKSIFTLTESNLADLLEQESAKYTQQNSFPTISAFGPNSAVVHYHHSQNNSKITPDNIYCIDSGRQYTSNGIFGTTDITRTIIIGNPTNEMKKDFTTVIKAHIAIANTTFPEGTTGKELDKLARSICQFPHSTGHGVSFCGPVHDITPNISPNSNDIIMPNMVFSIEPGIYIPNKYGIRIENLYYTTTQEKNLQLRPLTLVPFDPKLIDQKLLTKTEKLWLEKYNKCITNIR